LVKGSSAGAPTAAFGLKTGRRSGMIVSVRAKTRDARHAWIYAVALAFCILALGVGLWNGQWRGNLNWIGLLAVSVAGLNMAVLLRKELRKPHL
jgi:hypothetical protein